MAVTQAEAQRLVDDPSWTAPDPSPPATTYVVLMRGDFNDAGGKYKGWAVTAGRVGADTTTVVMSTRPELADHNWTALDLLLASGQLSGARSETVDLGVHELGKDVRLAWTLTGGPESRAVFRLRLVRTSDGLGASSTLGPMSFPGEMTRITNDRGLSLGGLEPGELPRLRKRAGASRVAGGHRGRLRALHLGAVGDVRAQHADQAGSPKPRG